MSDRIKFKKFNGTPKPEGKEFNREYWDKKLLSEIKAEPAVHINRIKVPRKRTLREKARDWFLEKFADLYERVRGEDEWA